MLNKAVASFEKMDLTVERFYKDDLSHSMCCAPQLSNLQREKNFKQRSAYSSRKVLLKTPSVTTHTGNNHDE